MVWDHQKQLPKAICTLKILMQIVWVCLSPSSLFTSVYPAIKLPVIILGVHALWSSLWYLYVFKEITPTFTRSEFSLISLRLHVRDVPFPNVFKNILVPFPWQRMPQTESVSANRVGAEKTYEKKTWETVYTWLDSQRRVYKLWEVKIDAQHKSLLSK